MICCFSQHHTGTWTALAWLNAHSDVEGFMQEAHAHDTLDGVVVDHIVESGTYTEEFHPNMVYHEHLARDPNSQKTRIAASQMVMMATHATLVPIRDPLASLITYQQWADRDGRSAEVGALFSPQVFVDVWCCLAASWETLQRFAHVRFVCWDLMKPGVLDGRSVRYLLGVARDLGLKDEGPARAWSQRPIHDNTCGEYRLKTAYQNRNHKFLRAHIAENGYNYLVSKRLQLRPFLEGLGYQDLQWWS